MFRLSRLLARLQPPPNLSEASATRTDSDTATVEFTSDETGNYYYVVLMESEEAPSAATINIAKMPA